LVEFDALEHVGLLEADWPLMRCRLGATAATERVDETDGNPSGQFPLGSR